ncbi:MAG: rhomboid family intramembrane serine protease [Oscillospiraceae bacterium]|nr:rhomboid family intramembrane serine protease [Oscillospiraceae bacterium]
MKKLQYNSPVVLTFFLLSLLSLLLGLITGGLSTQAVFSVYRASMKDPLTYLRFFGHVLGHADLNHFLSNMLLLLVVGPPLEEKYGSRTLLTGIVLTAFVSGLLQFILFPRAALLGASGIVFMLIMLSSLSGMKNGRIPVTLILVAILYLGQEVHSMIFVKDSVANFMHIVGGACGTAFGFYLGEQKIRLP